MYPFILDDLNSENVEALKFLSLEYIPMKKQESMIAEDDPSFIKELLFRINCTDLLIDKLRFSREEMEQELKIPGKAKISTYR
uniref:Uncharacterized protein n=1 Tax=Crocodylus porosus TaxID=8502 RepID=A0A7M4ELV6_CROPO